MEEHLTTSLRNFPFFLKLLAYLIFSSTRLFFSLSFSHFPLISIFHISLLSPPPSALPCLVISTIFVVFAPFLHLRCFGCLLGAFIQAISAMLIVIHDLNSFSFPNIFLQFWQVHWQVHSYPYPFSF